MKIENEIHIRNTLHANSNGNGNATHNGTKNQKYQANLNVLREQSVEEAKS